MLIEQVFFKLAGYQYNEFTADWIVKPVKGPVIQEKVHMLLGSNAGLLLQWITVNFIVKNKIRWKHDELP